MVADTVIEVLSESRMGWEEAAKQAVTMAIRTYYPIKIKSVTIKRYSKQMEEGKIAFYRILVTIRFYRY